MSKRIVVLGLALCALFVWAGAQTGRAAEPATHLGSRHMTGEVVRVEGQHLVLKQKGQSAEEFGFTVKKDAKLMRGTAKVALADLKPGEKVEVTYYEKGRDRLVEQVAAMHPTPAAAAQKKASK